MKKIVIMIIAAFIVAACYFGYRRCRPVKTAVLDKRELAAPPRGVILESQSQKFVKSFVEKDFKGDVLSINIESPNGEQIEDIRLDCKDPSWGGPNYSLSLDAEDKRYANVFKIGLGAKQSFYQLLYDREYVITSGEVGVTFRTPKSQEGKHSYEVDVKMPGRRLSVPDVPAQPSMKLVYDSSGIESDRGYVVYGDKQGIQFEAKFSENPGGFVAGRLGGELGIVDMDSGLVLCYFRKVASKNLGSLIDGSDVNFKKNTKLKVSIMPPKEAFAAKGAGIFFDENSVIPLARFPVDHSETGPSDALVYVGRWNLRWIGSNGVLESYNIVVTGDGKVERVGK